MLTPEELQVVGLSLKVALLVVATTLVPGVLVAWILARWRSRLALLLRGLVMLPLVLPPVVTGYGLLAVFGRSAPLGQAWHRLTGGQIAYTTTACVLAAGVVGFPLLVESVRLSIRAVDPRLEQVARTLGTSRLRTLLRVTLPLALPGILAGASLAFARALGEFGATMVLAGNIQGETRQIPLAVYSLLSTPGREDGIGRLALVSVLLSAGALLAAAWLSRRQERRGGVS